MSTYKKLRKFTSEELFLNEEETRIVLRFIFKPIHHELIDSLPMNDHLRGFAQGLLVEAIDASYAIGYIHGLFRSVKSPVKGALKILKSFGKKASQNWFKHASVHDIQNARVYNFVLDHMGWHFARVLETIAANNQPDEPLGAFLAYKVPMHGIAIRWG
ncbi:MAG: hypothetical protein L3J84_12980 [Gammaproteobacteria bacterium]|nr:hypothetical protein [Gammaproteobacteria bacterium]